MFLTCHECPLGLKKFDAESPHKVWIYCTLYNIGKDPNDQCPPLDELDRKTLSEIIHERVIESYRDGWEEE